MQLLNIKPNHNFDRIVRCYLTLDCNLNCWFCSALVPKISSERKKQYIPAKIWAEAINKKGRYTILAGGEPFLYPEFESLTGMLEDKYKVEIYTNLSYDVDKFVKLASRRYRFLISLHPGTKDYERWFERVKKLLDNGHSVRFHIVKVGNWLERRDFILSKGIFKTSCCDNQMNYPKSKGEEFNKLHPKVDCDCSIYLYGPDGYRYPCVHHLGMGVNKYEHISEIESGDTLEIKDCPYLGLCAPCDSGIRGKVIENDL